MRSLDASYFLDLLRGDAGAQGRAAVRESREEALTIPAPALAEFLRSGYRRCGGSWRGA